MSIEGALRTVLRETDGRRTETFASYRLAETVTRYGRFADNRLLAPLTGRRRARYQVDSRTLRVSEDLSSDSPPDALALQVAETVGRPLRVEFEARDSDHATVIDTSGIAEYRSF